MKVKTKFLLLGTKSLVLLHLALISLGQIQHLLPWESVLPFIKEYNGTLFHQKWTMFAPSPLNFSQEILYRCDSSERIKGLSEAAKKVNAHYPSIILQKKIFFFESFSTATVEEYKKYADATKCESDAACIKNFSPAFKKTVVARQLAKLLQQACGGTEPAQVALQITFSRSPGSEMLRSQRIPLWN